MTKEKKIFHWIQEKKQYIFIGVVLLGFIVYHSMSKNELDATIRFLEDEAVKENEAEEQLALSEDGNEQEQQITMIKVDIKGAVQNPGVYTAREGERVIDLIDRAGGFLDEADQTIINLSQKVSDEMVIYVPKVGEDSNKIEQITSISNSQAKGNDTSSDGKVNINQADSTMLQTLPGIGPSKADAIIEYRETNGPFKNIEDLMNVSGIGEKTFEKLKNSITVQ